MHNSRKFNQGSTEYSIHIPHGTVGQSMNSFSAELYYKFLPNRLQIISSTRQPMCRTLGTNIARLNKCFSKKHIPPNSPVDPQNLTIYEAIPRRRSVRDVVKPPCKILCRLVAPAEKYVPIQKRKSQQTQHSIHPELLLIQ